MLLTTRHAKVPVVGRGPAARELLSRAVARKRLIKVGSEDDGSESDVMPTRRKKHCALSSYVDGTTHDGPISTRCTSNDADTCAIIDSDDEFA